MNEMQLADPEILEELNESSGVEEKERIKEEQEKKEQIEDEADFQNGEEELRGIAGCDLEQTDEGTFEIKIAANGEATISSRHGEAPISNFSLEPYQIAADEEGGHIAILVAEREERGTKTYTFQSRVYKKVEQEIPIETVELPAEDAPLTEDQVVEIGSFWSEENQFDQEAGNNLVVTATAAEFEQATILEEPQTIESIAPQAVAIMEATSKPMIISPTSVEEIISAQPLEMEQQVQLVENPQPHEPPPSVTVKQEIMSNEENDVGIGIAEKKTVREPIKFEKPPSSEIPQAAQNIATETALAALPEKPMLIDDLAIDYQVERPTSQIANTPSHTEPQKSFVTYQIKQEIVQPEPLIDSEVASRATEVSPVIEAEKTPEPENVTKRVLPDQHEQVRIVQNDAVVSDEPLPLRNVPEIAVNTYPVVTQETPIKPIQVIENKIEPVIIEEVPTKPAQTIESSTESIDHTPIDIPKYIPVPKVETPTQASATTSEASPPEVVHHVILEKPLTAVAEQPKTNFSPTPNEVVSVKPEQNNLTTPDVPQISAEIPLASNEPTPVAPVSFKQPTLVETNTRIQTEAPTIKPESVRTETLLPPQPEATILEAENKTSFTSEQPPSTTPLPAPKIFILQPPVPTVNVEAVMPETINQITPLKTISAVPQPPAPSETFIPVSPEPLNPTPTTLNELAGSTTIIGGPEAPTTEPTTNHPEVHPLSPEVAENIRVILETKPIVQQENIPPLFPSKIPVRNQNNITTQSFSEVIATLEAAPLGTTIEIVGPVDEDGIVQDITILERTHDSATGEPIIQQRFFEHPVVEQGEAVPHITEWEAATVVTGIFTAKNKEQTSSPIVISEHDLRGDTENVERLNVKTKRVAPKELAPPPSAKPQPALVLTVSDQTIAPPATTTASPISIRTYAAN